MGVAAIARTERVSLDDAVARAQSGDVSAFEQLYRRHVDRVHAICLRMTANRARAEELTQESFLRAWRKLHLFHGGSFGAWIARLAANVVIAERRTHGPREAKERPIEDAPQQQAPPLSAAGKRIDLERALATLPDGARDVFVLHDVEGYRHEEVARMLDIATGTSKSQLHRARKLLREALRS